MNIIRLAYPLQLNELNHDASPQIVGIGFFDGVHKGHQELIRKTVQYGREKAIPASILTFDPHPREVLGHAKKIKHLTPLEEKCELFARLGIDRTYILKFDKDFSMLTPEQFIDEVIVRLMTDTVVVGFNFTFGHHGRGNVETFREHAAERYRLAVIRAFDVEGERVSSTLIRQHMHTGEIGQANQLLGRPYEIKGTVVEGEGRGRTIGIPTANLALSDEYAVPMKGVYAVLVTIDGEQREGVMNIGVKPTFHEGASEPSLEIHIFDFERNIYGKSLQVQFIDFIRTERKFDTVGQLVEQIRMDMKQAQERLKRHLLQS